MLRRWMMIASALMLATGLASAQKPASPQGYVKTRQVVSAPPQKLVFGLIALKNAEQSLADWAPFIEAMSKSLGVPVEGKAFPMQGDLVDGFAQGNVDVAWVGNVPALALVENGQATVFAQMVVNGQSAYRSVIVTHAHSPIQSLGDLQANKGKYVYGDGDVKSTSGHIVPRYFAFVRRGINDPDALFKEVRRGSLAENMERVARREIDLGTTNSNELQKFQSLSPELASQLRVVWQSKDIPESPLVYRNELSAPLKARLQAFVVNYGSRLADEKAALKKMNNLTGFRKSSNAQLVTIADVEMFNARQRINNDAKTPPEERAAKIDEAIKRGTRLELMLKLGKV
ncbi:phosphate/phosphite/phosphonate ABC transporter substrate-binding protein [Ramlibacter sp. WS9]|uniref:phosphate/phosphite/phosphonate ABC transporter substrate-binding protein n=1 Tax=Ramlibacter sp. WS9 TaxID=1882741 RepID=UPI0013053124|nr:phosphate/phosphite/phosphonate ABC transporter substrate-binding protein [Ramlibacter sp. WS9]